MPDPTAPDTASQLPAQGQAYRAPLPLQPVASDAAMWTGRTKSPLQTCQRAGGVEVLVRPVPTQPMPRVLASHWCHTGVTLVSPGAPAACAAPHSLAVTSRHRTTALVASVATSCPLQAAEAAAQAKRRQSAGKAPPVPRRRHGPPGPGMAGRRWVQGLGDGAGVCTGLDLCWDGTKKAGGQTPSRGLRMDKRRGNAGCSMGKGCRTRGCGSRSGVPCPPLPFPAPLRGEIQPRKGPWS